MQDVPEQAPLDAPPESAHRHVLRVFITGLLAALPLASTIVIFIWLVQLLLTYVGPESLFGRMLVALGLGIAGSTIFGYLIGLAMVLGAIFGLGVLVEAGLQRGLATLVETVVKRIPLVRNVYDMVHKLIGLFGKGQGDGLKSMSAVWCHFGGVGSGGAAALGLLGSPEPVLLGDVMYLAVLIPTSPVPVGGGLIYVPESWVAPADIGIEAVTSIYVSMGLTSGEHLSKRPPLMD